MAVCKLLNFSPLLVPVASCLVWTNLSGQSCAETETVAVVYSRPICLDELTREIRTAESLSAAELRRARSQRLAGIIWEALRTRFFAENGITVSDEDIDAFFAARGIPREGPDSLRQGMREFADALVTQWKFDRALYDRFGGTVIFQQMNPFEPVGAYRMFLEEHQAAGSFVILHEDMHEEFWEYYTREHPFVVPPDRVDFETPWWLKMAGPPEADRPSLRNRAYLASMRSDLRNLATAQEGYWADYGTYTSDLAALNFFASVGVTVEIISASARGWHGQTRHERLDITCQIYLGIIPDPPSGVIEGEVRCSGE